MATRVASLQPMSRSTSHHVLNVHDYGFTLLNLQCMHAIRTQPPLCGGGYLAADGERLERVGVGPGGDRKVAHHVHERLVELALYG